MCAIEAANTPIFHRLYNLTTCHYRLPHRGVYLILRFLGAAFIRGRRLFQKSEEKKMKSCVNSKQYDVF